MMKKLILFLVVIAMVSCGKKDSSTNSDSISNSDNSIETTLKDIVIEKGAGMVTDYESLSMEIDTVKVSDIKLFIEKCFPVDKYPNGVPADFKDEEFDNFIAPLKTYSSDNEVVYLAVKHKYSIFNPLIDKRVEVIQHRLLDPVSFKYIADDLREEKTWFAVVKYEASH